MIANTNTSISVSPKTRYQALCEWFWSIEDYSLADALSCKPYSFTRDQVVNCIEASSKKRTKIFIYIKKEHLNILQVDQLPDSLAQSQVSKTNSISSPPWTSDFRLAAIDSAGYSTIIRFLGIIVTAILLTRLVDCILRYVHGAEYGKTFLILVPFGIFSVGAILLVLYPLLRLKRLPYPNGYTYWHSTLKAEAVGLSFMGGVGLVLWYLPMAQKVTGILFNH